jgi:hypothetical protein
MLSKPQKYPFSLSLSPSLLRHEEEDEKATTDCARWCNDAQGRPLAFIALRCHDRGGKKWALTRHSKPMFTRLPDYSHIASTMAT